MNWFYKITGGRPMRLLDFAFRDTIDRRDIYYAVDKFGRNWMTTGRWSWFRIRQDEFESTFRSLSRNG